MLDEISPACAPSEHDPSPLLLLQGGRGPDQEPPGPPPPPLAFLDVPYFEGEGACGEKHLLDVYIPSAPFPRPRARTCLFVHGG